VLHQTFVLWEVLALRRRGVPIALYSLKRPDLRVQQPEARDLAREVHYLPGTFSLPVLAANFRTLLTRPRRYAAAYGRLIREWWRDRDAGREWKNRRIGRDAPDRLATFGERLAEFFNTNAFFYLLKSLWLVPRAVYLGRLLPRQGIDRIHAHWASYPATVALVMHWVFETPFTFTAHAYDIYLVPRLLRAKVREADVVVSCARINAAYLASLAGAGTRSRILVNYHGVDVDRFHPPAERRPAEMPSVVTCGRLEPYKGHHILLKACSMLPFPVRCVIVGAGPQRRPLERLAEQLGIAGRVEFTGPVSQVELARRYARADAFVLASVVLERSGKRDVIPNVLVEAMAMELPVIASDVSGIGELIADGENGRLVRPNDPAVLARAIEELLGDAELRRRLGANGRRRVLEAFNREANIEALIPIFVDGGQRAPADFAKDPAVPVPTGAG